MDKTADDDAEVNAIAMEIQQYLDKHPRSKDSLEGIRTWWLASAAQTVPSTQVERALERLIAHGLVMKEALPDGRMIYSRAKQSP